MRILCYEAPGGEKGREFIGIVKTSVPEAHVEYYATIRGFAERLRQKLDTKTIAIVRASSDHELIDLYFVQHLLSRVVLVLLLPDQERLTIAMGHRLHPCFMCTVDGDPLEFQEALESIARHGHAPKPMEAFRNPFEALVPHCCSKARIDSWINEAA